MLSLRQALFVTPWLVDASLAKSKTLVLQVRSLILFSEPAQGISCHQLHLLQSSGYRSADGQGWGLLKQPRFCGQNFG